jgi:hypothetical protein
LSILVIDAGYGFEGFGQPLGRFDFVSRMLTRPRPRPLLAVPRPEGGAGDLEDRIREYRVNRFRDSLLSELPVSLPSYYVTGFDEQKLEAEGIPLRFLVPPAQGDKMGPEGDRIVSYPVYLNGELRQESWWYYFLFALLYKVSEGTWLLTTTSFVVLIWYRRARAPWADELAVLAGPVVVLAVMSFGTNINLGLRYVLPIFPYVFVSAGKLAPWAAGLAGRLRWIAIGWVGIGLSSTVLAAALIHPHYLAYFNWASGGPARGSEHLIDSNLDWGQDLINLRSWLARHAPNERVGIAYFGQVPPIIFAKRGDPLNWFLPPYLPASLPASIDPTQFPIRYLGKWQSSRPAPGLYAVSASLVRGLPWRVYDSLPFYRSGRPRDGVDNYRLWAPYEAPARAFSYFEELTPIDTIGHSIFIYRITPEQAERLAQHWAPRIQ